MIVVVDYGMGNLRSVSKALEAAGADVVVSSRADDLRHAERIVLPGQGAFRDAMLSLRDTGLVDVLADEVRGAGKPLLGICLGLQLLANVSYEDGEHEGLGWIPARVERLGGEGQRLRVPHMGWDDVTFAADSRLTRGLRKVPTFYFAHSYHFVPESRAIVAATCDYGRSIMAAIQYENVFATQFHPEKSQEAGLTLLQNFMEWSP